MFSKIMFCKVSIAGLVILSGCTSLKVKDLAQSFRLESSGRRVISLEPKFARVTTLTEHLGYFKPNQMTPVVTDTMIYQGNAIDSLIAYNRRTGSEIWRFSVSGGVEAGAELGGNTLFFGGGDGFVRALNALNGKPIWSFDARAELLAPPTYADGVLYFQTGADVTFAVDAASGKLKWSYSRQVTSNLSVRASSRPVVADELLLTGYSDGYVVALSRSKGSLQWESKLGRGNRFRDVDATPVVDGDRFYTASFDGSLVAMKVKSGETLWQVDHGGYLPVTLGKGANSDRLYFSTTTGLVLEIDRASGKETQRYKVPRGIASQPVTGKNVLVFGESQMGLRVLDVSSFQPITQYETGEGITATPYFDRAKGEIWVMSVAANLYGFKIGYENPKLRVP